MLKKLYTFLFYLVLPIVFMRLIWRGMRNAAYWRRWRERMGYVDQSSGQRNIWLHAVSVGEVRATVPLVDALRKKYTQHRIFITTMTPTGSEQVKLLYGDSVQHSYMPYDIPAFISRFLDRINPEIFVVMETELWPNSFSLCAARNIPIILVNMRLSESSVRGYLKLPSLFEATLSLVSRMAVQSAIDAQRLLRLGADKSKFEVTGNIKFDIRLDENLLKSASMLRTQWGQERPIWLAASTHEGEDEQLLQAYKIIKQHSNELLLVLVPRHPERFSTVIKLCHKSGYHTVTRSASKGNIAPDVDIIVGDTMGELQLFYAACDVAFIGGSLVPVGGHNLLEASVVGKPAVFGPYMHNFSDISALVKEHGAGRQIDDISKLVEAVSEYLSQPESRKAAGESGRHMIEENRGALAKTMQLIEQEFRA